MSPTRRHFLAISAFAATATRIIGARASNALALPLHDAVQKIMAGNGIPGAAAALIVGGEPIWTKCFGTTKSDDTQPIDAHTIFSIQSCSKTFTATAVMLAVQRGLAELDAPIVRYLPDFTVNSRFDPAPQEKITLRHLLSHHAGFTHEAPIGNNYTDTPWTFDAHIRSIQETWLRYPVGERFAYSNLGLDLAARILERVSGMSYFDCLKAWLLAPLGMSDTTANPDEYAIRTNRAIGHMPGFGDIPVRIPLLGSGSVYSSITDMARYAAFHMAQGRTENAELLVPALWREMYDFRYGSNYALGMGRRIETFNDSRVRIFGHDGGGFGFACCFNFCPAKGVAWIVLFNGMTRPIENPQSRLDDLILDPILRSQNLVPQKPALPAFHAAAIAPEVLQRWVGSYLSGDAQLDMTLEGGSLVLRSRGDTRPSKLVFVSSDEAWIAGGPMTPQRLLFYEANGVETQRFSMTNSGDWDFNDGPGVPPGPVRDGEYDAVCGRYEIDMFGKPLATAVISKRNGYLYYNDIRAIPYRPGLFFGGSGEALDLRGPIATARNIPLKRLV